MPTENQNKIIALADCLFSLRLKDSAINMLTGGAPALLQKCDNSAALVNNPSDVIPFTDSGVPLSHGEIQAIRSAANNVIEVIDDISMFISRAKAAGFVPPSNPFAEIARFNENRSLKFSAISETKGQRLIAPIMIDRQLADDLAFNLDILLRLAEREKEGTLGFNERSSTTGAAAGQISSYSLQLAGYDMPLAEGVVDLLSFIPNVDKIKRARIRESLGQLNFKNRIPKIIFTAKYDPDNVFQGAIVGWKRIPDASGYRLRRHSVFDNKDVTFELSNEQAAIQYNALKDYIKEWVLSFYEQFDDNSIYAFLDKNVTKHNFYTYHLKAVQNARRDSRFVFDVDVAPFPIAMLQLSDIEKEMQNHVDSTIGTKLEGATFNDISPYPFLSKKYYGHDKYDWIIAAANTLAAIERGDDRATVRRFSYLGADLSFLRDQIQLNKFFRPLDPNEVIKNLKESIATFGVSQTILEIIEATGLDLFFGSKESPQEDTFTRATAVFDERRLGGLTTVLAAIDPETATVDMESLVSNLLIVLQGSTDATRVDESSSPTEIDVPDTDDKPESAEDPIQFVGEFDPSVEVLDLTTFEGMSEFVRTIRLFFDLNPNRASFGSGPSGQDLRVGISGEATLMAPGAGEGGTPPTIL